VGAAYSVPTADWGVFSANVSYQVTGKRPLDQANSEFLGRFYEVAAGASWETRSGLTFRLQAANLLNSKGITEGDPRSNNNVVANLNAPYANYRPILPRSVVGSVTYRF
jgi:hypothetical protein